MTKSDEVEFKHYKEIERQLKLKNAELNLEIEKYKVAQTTLEESYGVLTLVSEISKDIIEKGRNLNIDETLKTIGIRMALNKIFLLRFSSTIESYKEWCSNKIHETDLKIEADTNLVPLMNWVYEKQCFSGSTDELPKYFEILDCPKDKTVCGECNLIMVPIIIDNKPWGIMGYAKGTQEECASLTKKTIKNLTSLLSVLIKNQEENIKIVKMIDSRLETFRLAIKRGNHGRE